MKGPKVDEESAVVSTSHSREVDFSEYMWMGEEMEQFDNECLLELCEQEFIESCFEELFEEEEKFAGEIESYLERLTPDEIGQLVDQLNSASLNMDENAAETAFEQVEQIQMLNPDAEEFIPLSETEAAPDDEEQ
jgi:hypothetical protein